MSDQTINVNIPPERVQEAILKSAGLDTLSATDRQTLLLMAGIALLGRIHRAFVVKARGGTDDAGERWVPLSPKTIAYGRARRTKTENKRDARPSQALTKKQSQRWWELYRQGLAMYRGNKASAAKRAWGILRREGATTLYDKYHGRRAEILRDTGTLLNSLSPVVSSPNQVLRADDMSVSVGTNVPYAAVHHYGVPGRIPQRRLWPSPDKWPKSWWKDILEQIKLGMIDLVIQAFRRQS